MPGQSLEAVANTAWGREPVNVRAQRLLQHFQALAAVERDEALQVLAAALAERDPGYELLRCLAAWPLAVGRVLALELASRLPLPLDRALLPVYRPLLLDRRLPAGLQLAAVVALLSATGKSGPAAVDLLAAFVTGLDKTQVKSRLAALQQRIGSVPALAEMYDRLEAKLSRRCPHCGQALQRADMMQHLWQQHGLVLDGPLVREPWSVLEDWLTEAASRNDPDCLARCFEMAQHVDPEHGLVRLERLLQRYGLEDELAGILTPEARGSSVIACPHCAAAVVPADLSPLALNLSRGRLSGAGYLVQVSERGLVCRLTVETPEGVIFEGREPGQSWTRQALTLALVGPPIGAAFVLALVGQGPMPPVALLLIASLATFLLIRLRWRGRPNALDRAIDHAWNLLVPRLHAQSFSVLESAFLAGLAEVSLGRGSPGQRERVLERALAATEQAVARQKGVLKHLACLWHLAADDAARLGRDPTALLARVITRCLEGSLPLAVADHLLHGWTGNAARLRALVCEQAFETGFEVADLLTACRLAPALGRVLGSNTPDNLAQLWLLWSLRTARPWENCGEAFTVFELAGPGRPGAAALEKYPDLLLYQFVPGISQGATETAAVVICSRGIVFADRLYSELAAAGEIMRQGHLGEGLARRLERWLQFFFQVFVPRTAAILNRPGTAVTEKWKAAAGVVCPQCGGQFLPSDKEA